jgi:hypothetical protein
MSPTIGEPITEGSLAVSLARAEVDQQIMTAHAFPRKIREAVDNMASMATLNPDIAEECIYSLPRGGKQIRGPSIRFAEIVANAWGNCRDAARVTFVDRIERYVEAEGIFHDLQTNRATTSRVKRIIEIKRKTKAIDNDMIQLAGAAAMSIARRNAILGGVPKPVWGQALAEVEAVIRGDISTLSERRVKAMQWFSKAGIPVERVLKALAAPSIEEITLDDLISLNGWRTSLLHGDATVEDLFPEDKPPAERKTLDQKLDALAGDTNAGGPPIPPEQGTGDGVTSNAPHPPEPTGAATDGRTPEAAAPPQDEKVSPAQIAAASRRSLLTTQGNDAAAKGQAALKAWLDDLDGNDSALVTVTMTRAWSKTASAKP